MKRGRTKRESSGFTMIELLLAISLLSVIVIAAFLSFSTVNRVWRTGTGVADSLHHSDFIMEQLAMALRSAYYPDNAGGAVPAYGMVLVNDGEGEEARDQLSWVKLGAALVGEESEVRNSLHKIVVTAIGPGESEDPSFSMGGIVIKAWRMVAQPDDFDSESEEYVQPLLLSPGVIGIDFKVLSPENNLEEGKYLQPADLYDDEPFEWIDEDWTDDYTNRLPWAVQATLWLPPMGEGGEAIPVRRMIQIPAAPLSWPEKFQSGKKAKSGKESSTSRGENLEGGDNRRLNGRENNTERNRRSGKELGVPKGTRSFPAPKP